MKLKQFGNYRKYALVTGAASGMGRIYCQKLALMGYNIVAVDINAGKLDETCSIVRNTVASVSTIDESLKSGFVIRPFVQDLSASNAADAVYEMTSADGIEVEVLVNNAGIMYCKGIAETSEHLLELIMSVHMTTPLMLCRKYVNGMKERGCGYILNISSLAA